MTSSIYALYLFIFSLFGFILFCHFILLHFILFYTFSNKGIFLSVQLGSNVYRKDIMFSSFSNSKHIIMSLTVTTNSMCKMDYGYSVQNGMSRTLMINSIVIRNQRDHYNCISVSHTSSRHCSWT